MKKYQIFISSTSEDLKEERSAVIDSVLKLRHIPVAMEHFVSTNEETFKYIKKLLDDTDYYIVIVGNRYGSVADDGYSYTEKEYNYAISSGIPVIACVHSNPEALPSDNNQEAKEKLQRFREKIMHNRIVCHISWSTPAHLTSELTAGLVNTIIDNPRPGWRRSGSDKSESNILSEWKLEHIFKTRGEKNNETDIILENHQIKELDGIAFELKQFRTLRSQDLLECMKKGARIRLLVMDPNSIFLRYKAEEEGADPIKKRTDIISLTEWVRSLNEQLRNYLGRQLNEEGILLKYYNAMTLDYYWRVDDRLYFGPYWYGIESLQTVTYEYRLGGRGYRLYSEHFDTLWDNNQLTTKVNV